MTPMTGERTYTIEQIRHYLTGCVLSTYSHPANQMLRYAISNLDTPEHGIEAVTARAYEGNGEHVCAFTRMADDRCAVCGVDLTHSTGRRNWRPT
jgi:hypothetical protein